MPNVFNEKTIEFKKRQSPIPEFSWQRGTAHNTVLPAQAPEGAFA